MNECLVTFYAKTNNNITKIMHWLLDNKMCSRVSELLIIIIIRRGKSYFTCPYQLKVQTCPPRDRIPALRSRVSEECPRYVGSEFYMQG